jgi:methylated-DNA-[protein]-cysteine S-methyltransferase
MKKDFSQKVVEIVRKIPKGKVLTYKEVAKRAGSPRAYRAVGNIMSKNMDKNVPCHRVIKSDGTPGGYSGLRGNNKREILRKEGVVL